MGVMVLLKHTLPDGGHHFDWLMEPAGNPMAGLVSFRVQDRVDSPDCREVIAVKIADHRREYLTYEGEIAGDRGHVTRVAAGLCTLVDLGDDILELMAVFAGHPPARWIARCEDGRSDHGEATWRFIRQPGG